ncbi:MAG: nickel-responsive transcriptional regulator NikR, partial [Armatimonadetes bacterium]|nr:nickel-responsive transcriptional regulator NikR [Armatimonadota bacterium]
MRAWRPPQCRPWIIGAISPCYNGCDAPSASSLQDAGEGPSENCGRFDEVGLHPGRCRASRRRRPVLRSAYRVTMAGRTQRGGLPAGERPMENVTRFSVSMEPGLLRAFDRRLKRSGYDSRSRAVADIVRAYLVDGQWQDAGARVVGTVTIVYDHRNRDVEQRLTELQHAHHDAIACATHVHLDHDDCLEVIVVRG